MNPSQRIYLDHNATSPIAPEVAQAVFECYQQQYANPASQHFAGQAARTKLEAYRRKICEILGACTHGMSTDQLVFTSGGTESNNLAIFGLAQHLAAKKPSRDPIRILVSAIEHPSILSAAALLATQGFRVEKIPVDSNGICRLDSLLELLKEPAQIVSLMLANNETGAIQPVESFARVCREKDVLFHCDAVQAVGKIPVNFREAGFNAMTFTAHKFHGPRGVGGLLLRHGVELQPILVGGFQQMGIRPGTENLGLIAGMNRALELFVERGASGQKELQSLRDHLQKELSVGCPNVVINSGGAPRVPHTLNLSFRGLNRQAFLMAADMAGLDLSTGSACASGSSDPSHVLVAMGVENDVLESSIRISLGAYSTAAEISEAARRIINVCKHLQHANNP